MEYLTEKVLYEKLTKLGIDFVHDKKVPGSIKRTRPDFRLDESMLIIEFDGHHHFTNPKRIIDDESKDIEYKELGYTIIRIPYFIQLDETMIKYYFKEYDVLQSFPPSNYPHGFIDKNALTPAHFCSLGIKKFENILSSIPSNVGQMILDSLKNKEIELGKDLVWY